MGLQPESLFQPEVSDASMSEVCTKVSAQAVLVFESQYKLDKLSIW